MTGPGRGALTGIDTGRTFTDVILVVKIKRLSPLECEDFCGVREGIECRIRSTLMSAITRCRRVNSWLACKRLFWALPGRAGDTVVETTVDHTLMRGSDRMTVDASRSCLGIATCVGSATRRIVDARVLLTATVPPALPGRSVSDGSLAPPVNGITHTLAPISLRSPSHAERWPR